MAHPRGWTVACLASLALAAGSLWLTRLLPGVPTTSIQQPPVAEQPRFSSYSTVQSYYDEAYQVARAQPVVAEGGVRGAVVPHHMFVRYQLAALFASLEPQASRIETVVIVGPDHLSRGALPVTTSAGAWATPYGTIAADRAVVAALTTGELAREDDAAIASEHAIGGLVAFVRRSLPRARVVPLMLRSDVTPTTAAALASALAASLNPEASLVIASVDFSHYQPAAVADFHDEVSRGVVAAGDIDRLWQLEVDSPASLAVMLGYLRATGAQRGQLAFATNSGRLVGQADEPTTSHQGWLFSSGQPAETSVAGLMFVGDVMLDRNVRGLVAERGLGYILDELAGEERRFFRGVDEISANLEGAVTNGGAHYPPAAGIDFAFDPATVGQLGSYGFSFFNTANNHTVDQGRRGWDETQQNLAQAGFAYAGCPDGEVGECSATTTQAGSLQLGWAGFSSVYRPFDLSRAAAAVAQLASTTDFVTVQVHWGQEYTHRASAEQQRVAHALIEAGADLIIGHHPHVVQGVERYRGKLIFYSLGNFIFDQYFSPETQRGLAVGITVQRQVGSRAQLSRAHIYPLASSQSRLRLLAGDERAGALRDLAAWSQLSSADLAAAAAGSLP